MKKALCISIKSRYCYIVRKVTHTLGGFREKEILRNPHRMEKSETWNDDHKVVNIIANETDASGHADAYSVDVVTGRICG